MKNHMIPKKWTFLSALLALLPPLGILLHSGLLFAANRLYPPAGTPAQVLMESRLPLRHAGELTAGICFSLFQLGAILLIWHLVRTGKAIPLPRLFVPFLASAGGMFLCALPFALLDSASRGDHLFPIWGNLITLALYLLILAGVDLYHLFRPRT